ncbi:hypothetical protein FA95DRAFT_1555017 [Auriscalpium vulgare]|uniref:Uncharacterized protein n=1 Tax=Auriscalpium vulgare TaxID=40419 RepID=A0ACB8S4G5_9AGAM|nr:hypothetical protein FA95DRAFT_1555017 [Auriscalpium vulgare]
MYCTATQSKQHFSSATANTPMATSRHPTSQFVAEDFLICGGSILFRNVPPSPAPLEVCLLLHGKRNEWLLPKGRKDRGEALPAAAVRETYEETGFPCALLPVTMPTRAPLPGAQTKDAVDVVHGCSEPFMMTLRHVADANVKLIWWYVTVQTGEKVAGTQTAVEDYTSEFMSVDEAIRRAAFQSDRDVIARAAQLVRQTYGDGQS